MKKMFRDDFDLSEIRNLMRVPKRESKNDILKAITIIGVVAIIGATIYLIIKSVLRNNDDYDLDEFDDYFDGECDENGCYYTDEDDFVE